MTRCNWNPFANAESKDVPDLADLDHSETCTEHGYKLEREEREDQEYRAKFPPPPIVMVMKK